MGLAPEFVWICVGLVVFGWVWLGLADFGNKIWVVFGGFDLIWLGLVGFGY